MAGTTFAEFIDAVREVEGEFANKNELLAVLLESADDPGSISAASIRRAAAKRRQAGTPSTTTEDLWTMLSEMMERPAPAQQTINIRVQQRQTQYQHQTQNQNQTQHKRQTRPPQSDRRAHQQREARELVEYRAAALRKAVAARRNASRGRQQSYEEICHDLYDLATANVILAGIKVVEQHLNGYWGMSYGGKIAIVPSLDYSDKLWILHHELGHEIDKALPGWGAHGNSHVIREFHADSVAIELMRQYNMSAPQYVFDRTAQYRAQITNLAASLRRIEQITEHCLGILGFHQRTW